MDDPTAQFYDDLADDYHLLFEAWSRSVLWQGEVLDRLIRGQIPSGARSVLDCACGIGTQAIGLAGRGYQVHATDFSPAAVARAEREAVSFGVPLTTGTADLRTLTSHVAGEFDVVLACDNALPHLLSDDELLDAARNMRALSRRGGLVLASIRDYDQILAQPDRPRSELPRVVDGQCERRIVFQVWDWDVDGRTYTFHLFIVREAAAGWQTTHRAARYRALLRDELSSMLELAGLSQVRWLLPDESGYYQPLVVARNL
jgi:glycine/sarcosine N-methyltransferase